MSGITPSKNPLTPSKGGRSKPKGGTGFLSVVICVLLCCMLGVGVLLMVTMLPSDGATGPAINSLLGPSSDASNSKLLSFSEKIAKWVPRLQEGQGLRGAEDRVTPPWEKEFWTPIDIVDVDSTPVVILCKLNFREYSEQPHLTSMFKDLVAKSKCMGGNRRRESLKSLLEEINDPNGGESARVVAPNGFVFHESRVGSTLVANFLASDPLSLVFSESAPAANALLHCDACTREHKVQLFRDVVTLMGRSPFHQHLFFKFQSITVTHMDIALEAFPEVPWVFVYRQPVQTMMSHMDPRKDNNGNAPCMRSKRRPPKEVQADIDKYVTGWGAPNEAWCAAHLNMLCSSAVRSMEKYGTHKTEVGGESVLVQRGLFLNYDSLPGIVPAVLLPHFGVDPVPARWLRKISEESGQYSKSRGSKAGVFLGDSKDKVEHSTQLIKQYGEAILGPTYELMQKKALLVLESARPGAIDLVLSQSGKTMVDFDWKLFSPLSSGGSGSGSGSGSSSKGPPHLLQPTQHRPHHIRRHQRHHSQHRAVAKEPQRGLGF
mmetsp:Transcript_1970/g.4608  ORF Transcript_1970/g.4608 Transcript_1970/m.4608 type:complete len:546 (-) Transcript_1970:110-1747(-)